MATLAKQLNVSPSQELAIFYELLDHLRGWNIESVSEAAGLSPSTIYFWLAGDTVGRLENVIRVGAAIGLELRWVSVSGQAKTPKLTVV
ncbi:MAG: helix-turn-helix domain-containing protein [Aliifodinibius sp.]|nr:helix-turn-helix transcriptional regulator [Fodinibius sp.]NIY26971.1 helix-turn-helix domain-containing protein [Fodinibius sp.]